MTPTVIYAFLLQSQDRRFVVRIVEVSYISQRISKAHKIAYI